MTDESEDSREPSAPEVLDALQGQIDEMGIPVSVLTVVKYVDRRDGDQHIALIADQSTTPLWDHMGMIEYAREILRGELAIAAPED